MKYVLIMFLYSNNEAMTTLFSSRVRCEVARTRIVNVLEDSDNYSHKPIVRASFCVKR